MFAVGEDGMPTTTAMTAKQFCISVEQPSLTLQGVVNGMLSSDDCQSMPAVRQRYAEKVFAVLRIVAKGLRHLHSLDLVHGSVNSTTCAKYQNRWKLCNVLRIKAPGQIAEPASPIPPELQGSNQVESSTVQPSHDIWAFGCLAFEVLVGEPLFGDDDHLRRQLLGDWDRVGKQSSYEKLVQACVPSAGAELILSCLSPDPRIRPSMSDVLLHNFWRDFKRQSTLVG